MIWGLAAISYETCLAALQITQLIKSSERLCSAQPAINIANPKHCLYKLLPKNTDKTAISYED